MSIHTGLIPVLPGLFSSADRNAYDSGRGHALVQQRRQGRSIRRICCFPSVLVAVVGVPVDRFKAAKGRAYCFPFDPAHPLHATHIQVPVSSLKSLRISLCVVTSFLYQSRLMIFSILSYGHKTRSYKVLLGLFYPRNYLRVFRAAP